MVGEDAARGHPGVGAGGGSHSAVEAGLPVSHYFEVGEPGEAERVAAGAAGLCGRGEDSAAAGGGGCGCFVVDVNRSLVGSRQSKNLARLSPRPLLSSAYSVDCYASL